MNFEVNRSGMFSDLLIPEVFVTEYLPELLPGQVKIYLYAVFLSARKLKVEKEDLCVKLGMTSDEVDNGLLTMEALGLLQQKRTGIVLSDLKEKELNKHYREKTSLPSEDAEKHMARNRLRIQVIQAINKRFFQGVMPSSWYADIDSWFEKFGFEEDVMLALFQHCYDHKVINKNYILKVAQSWHLKGIVNSIDLDNYSIEYQKVREIIQKVSSKLRTGKLTEYEEAFVRKWVMEFGYGFDIIELALKKTTRRLNVGFEYIDKIICEWNEFALKTVDEVSNYEKNIRKAPAKVGDKASLKKDIGGSSLRKGFNDKDRNDLIDI
ncbi:MAG: DnaD domain protein [Clostridia bacterium]